MTAHYDLIIKDGTCVITTKDGQLKQEITNLGVNNGKIQAIGLGSSAQASSTIDAKGLHILPGIIDSQVHFREPGLEHKEDLYTGTLSAIAGGVTSVFEMPNTNPSTSTKERFEEKIKLAESKAKCDFAFFIGATNDNHEQLPQLERLPGCSGVKIFMGSSTGGLLVAEDHYLEKILRHPGRRIAVHCEDEFILKARKHLAEAGGHAKYHPVWRNIDSAFSATKRIVAIAEKYNRPIHTLHITTAEEIDFLRQHKNVATVECLPQHLTLTGPECYERLGSYAQMNPPIREQRHQDALWAGISDGTVDVLGSDHAPHTREEKDRTYPLSPSGLTGVQTILPLMLNHHNQGRLTLERLCQLLSVTPARIYGAQAKGGIEVGKDADFSIVDLKKEKTISNSWIQSRTGWTPYDGMPITGWPTHTIVRGQIAMQEGQIFSNCVGKSIQF